MAVSEPTTTTDTYPYYGHDRGVVVTQPRPGEFEERPMTGAERHARDAALAIAKDIYRHANYAGVCYHEIWELIAKAIQGALDDRESASELDIDPSTHPSYTSSAEREINAAPQADSVSGIASREKPADSPAAAAPSDTPRTDAQILAPGEHIGTVCADFARQLERALAQEKAYSKRLFERLAPSIEYVEATPVGYGEDEIDRLRAELDALKSNLSAMKDTTAQHWCQEAEFQKREVARKQAEIDRLMLEFCPEEMTPEQIEEWRKHQVRVSPEEEAALERAIHSSSTRGHKP